MGFKRKFNSEHGSYEGTHVVKKCDKESDADEILRKLSADTGPATVKSIKEKSFWREKPYLYSLQGLQMDANKVYGFSLQHTLDLAQSLYEKGFTTYPRTDSSHLTDDMGPEMKKVIQMLFHQIPILNLRVMQQSRLTAVINIILTATRWKAIMQLFQLQKIIFGTDE